MEEVLVIGKEELLEVIKKKYVQKFKEWVDENLTLDDVDEFMEKQIN